jgi:hypothetical protein
MEKNAMLQTDIRNHIYDIRNGQYNIKKLIYDINVLNRDVVPVAELRNLEHMHDMYSILLNASALVAV